MSEAPQNQARVKALVARIWEQKKHLTLNSVAAIERASSALIAGLLTPELRGQAAIESHKLAGALGTFGFPEGSRLSRLMEGILTKEADLNCEDGELLAELVQQLRRELDSVSSS
jgi:HPt (histidine-containing phosphotransfer) domain-containing protein